MLYCPILYPHRKTADGSYISFCPACFAPIARSKVETELAEQDKRHVCNSSFLAVKVAGVLSFFAAQVLAIRL